MTHEPYIRHDETDPHGGYRGGPPPHYAPPGQAQVVVRGDRNGLGTAGLVLGIIAVLFALIPIIGIIAWFIAPLGLIFGFIGMSRAKKREATNRGVAIAGVVTSAVALVICVVWVLATAGAAATSTSSAPGASSAARQPAAAAPAPAAPSGPLTSFGDGTYEVGQDIVPGRYKTPGPPADSIVKNCYWQRTKDDTGQFDSIIANGNAQGQGSVTIKKGEFFQTSGGCTWTKQ